MNTATSDSSNPSPTPQVDIIRNGELYKQFTNKKPNESSNEENLKSTPKASTLTTELFNAISTSNESNKQSEGEVDDDSASMNENSDKKRGVKRTKSSFKGVFKCGKKFKAQIQTHGVQHYLGLFDSEEEAARAYDSHARLVLGMKAKTNFPFDPSENSPEQNLLQPKIFEENVNKDSNKQPIGKRSYVGMKVRKKTVQDMLEANHKSAFINFPRPLSFIHPNFPRPLGHSLMHVPLQLSQAPHLLSNIPAGYAPVLHSMRFVSNPTFLNPAFPSTATNKSHANPTTNATSSIDWSKQSYYPLDIPESNQPENAGVEPDWRDQIYYWTGKFSFDESSKLFLWKGKWLGSFTGKPSMAELEASQNDFVYHSLRPISKPITRTKSGNIIPLSGSFDGTYHMENEEESEDYQDTEFFIDFEEYNGNYLAFGKGDSEFGSFVTFGKYDPISSTLEMNRQFVADSDIRSSMSLQQLKELFKQSISQV